MASTVAPQRAVVVAPAVVAIPAIVAAPAPLPAVAESSPVPAAALPVGEPLTAPAPDTTFMGGAPSSNPPAGPLRAPRAF